MPTEHAAYGSSTAKRTNNCQGWRYLSKDMPNKESNAAAEGTCIHTLNEEAFLDDDYSIAGALGTTVNGILVTDDIVERAEALQAAAQGTIARHELVEWEPEVRATVADDVFGTLDFVGVTADGKTMVLGDIKSGQGHQVAAESNDQILFAAWAMLDGDSTFYDEVEKVENFIGVIWQPDRGGEVQTKEWSFSPAIAAAWGEVHHENIRKARASKGENPNPGDWCAFCPAAPTCPAKTGDALRALQLDPEDLASISESMSMIEDLKAWIRAVEKTAYNALEIGQTIDGWKLVAKRATRKWIDEEAALAKIRRPLGGKKAVIVEKLITPAQAEKAAKAAGVAIDLEELTVRESSGTTLAPESDKREAVLSSEAFAAALDSVQ
jgi:hypothetical protein